MNNVPSLFDVLGAWNDGLQGKSGPKAQRGHSDFPGHELFDYTKETHDPETQTFNPKSTWRHFRPLNDSEIDLAKAVQNCEKDSFERYAHQMQDFFSHYGQGYRAQPYDQSLQESLKEFAYTLFVSATPSVPLSQYDKMRLEKGAQVMANYPKGHLWPSVTGVLPGISQPDNAEDFEDAFKSAGERSAM